MGERPHKPENASAIGFSDSLWGFAQRCWDGNRELRPKVAEVVAVLGMEAANWKGLMPPGVQVESEPESDSTQYCESKFLILPLVLPIEQRYRQDV